MSYDLVVIGSGPGGYVGAIRAAQLGFKTACIEKDPSLGGTCLNVGCIPSKAMLESSENYFFMKHHAKDHGIQTGEVRLDLAQMLKRKEGVVQQLTRGIAGLFKKNKVDSFQGIGKILKPTGGLNQVQVSGAQGNQILQTKNILIATGSEPVELPFLPFDRKRVVDSTGALAFQEIPKHLVVVGGGVIGLELGSVWARLGSRVTVIEFQNKILSTMDGQAAAELQKSLEKQGIEFLLSTKCLGAQNSGMWMIIEVEDLASKQRAKIECDYVLVATGRRPYTEGLGLTEAEIALDSKGRVQIDEHFLTTQPGIYAVGDVVSGPMLAHKAEDEAIAAVEIMAGQAGHVNYDAIPGVVYTWPELASVGATEEELKEAGISYKAGKFPFMANGRAKAMGDVEGFVKILADTKTDRVLGAHIVGPNASELISELTTVIEYGGSAEDVARTCHAHPTLSEVTREAALDVGGRKIHL